METKNNALFLISSFGEISLMLNEAKNFLSTNIVVFDNKDLYKFLLKLEFKNSQIHFIRKPGHSIKNPISYIKARNFYNKNLKFFEKKYKDIKKIYCFHIYGNIFCYKLIKRITRKESEVYIYECLKFSKSNKIKYYPELLARSIILFFIYGIYARVFITEHKFFETFKIDSIRCKKKIISFDECQIIRKNFNIRDYFSFPNSYTHIFFDQPVVNYGRVSKEEYTMFINNIKKHFSDEIKNKSFCVKLHPGNYSDLDFYKGLEIIPSYIPSECLEADKNSIWLAISSQTLWTNNDAKKIALIDLINYESELSQKYIKESLLIKHKKVFIPKSFKDLRGNQKESNYE